MARGLKPCSIAGRFMKRFSLTTTAVVAGLALAGGVGAKPARTVRPKPAPPAAEVPAPAVPNDPASGMVPKEVKLRPTTAAEAEANAIWSTRAALNIAALQCQFSPFLATVRNYNDFLRQHSDELDRARSTMLAHFKRYDASQAQNSFDRYTTQTYNSYSTLDAQYSFCQEAAVAGRTVLTVRKGDLGRYAGTLRDQIRAALIPIAPLSLIQPVPLVPIVLPTP